MNRRPLSILLASAIYTLSGMVLIGPSVQAEMTTTTPHGLWLSISEVKQLPMSGQAWENVKQHADDELGLANISDQDTTHNIKTMAAALVYARLVEEVTPLVSDRYRQKAADAILSVIGTESGSRSLALGRNIAAYVIAADLINFEDFNPSAGIKFKAWIKDVIRKKNKEGRSIIGCHNERPNNWGTMCGGSRIAVDLYLNDIQDLEEAIKVFKGWSGDRLAWDKFEFGQDAAGFMCDPQNPRPLNPVGCIKDGHEMSGAPVDDMRRGGTYDSSQWLSTGYGNHTNYAWGGLSGTIAQAELLHRAGYPAYEWEERAMFRGAHFLFNVANFSLSKPTEWVPWVLNHRYDSNFPTETPVGMGRLIGWSDWTHGPRRTKGDPFPPLQPPKGLKIYQRFSELP